MKSILRYIYTGIIDVKEENAFDLMVASKKLSMFALKKWLQNFLISHVDQSNVLQLCEKAKSVKSKGLYKKCLEVIRENISILVSHEAFLSFSQETLIDILEFDNLPIQDELDLLYLVIRWGRKQVGVQPVGKVDEHQPDDVRDCIAPLLAKIRFSDVSSNDLSKLKLLNILPAETIIDIFSYHAYVRADQHKDIELLQKQQTPGVKHYVSRVKNTSTETPSPYIDSSHPEISKKPSNQLNYLKSVPQDNSQIQNSRTKKPEINYEDLKKMESSSIISNNYYYVKKIKKWINDNQFFDQMNLTFRASRDGYSSKTFHQVCDDKGKTLTLIESNDGFIFGGYTTVGWKSNVGNNYILDNNAFLFSLKNPFNQKPQKFAIVNGEEKNAIRYHPERGPKFGYGDLGIGANLQIGWSNFGRSFQLPQGVQPHSRAAKEFLAGGHSFKVKEVEVFTF
eukprot:Anaeramoba_ignava/c19130_g1_i1.p1 GENE.c19130_g1_i1~~c19130_g1_i1.p1  ORF type:complete len:452 (+),score=77.21 c19130_g1_i1:263-1618(+)